MSMLTSLSITQMLWHIYSIVDGNLYAMYEEMLILVELHRIQMKCCVKNNQMKRLGNMNFFAWSKLVILKYKIIILNHKHVHRQDFNVHKKQYDKETGYLRLTLDSQGEKARGKPFNSLAKSQEKKLQATCSRVGTFRWPPVHGLPHMDYQMDYPNGLSNGLPRWTTHMDYLINYPRKRKERNITPSLFALIDSPPISLFVFTSIAAAQIICRRIYCRI